MRDILLSMVIFGILPIILFRPYFGVLVWTWLGYMNPHRFTWGFANQMPFSAIVGGTTLVAWLFSRERKYIPLNVITIAWLLFLAHMALSTFNAQLPEDAATYASRVFKIQLFALVTVAMTTDWKRVRSLVWVIVLSLAFFGVKGGVWVLLTGGAGGRVWGPPYSFIEGNNELALALLIILPLMYWLARTTSRRWVKNLLLLSMLFTTVSVIGSFSRGAVVAGVALAGFLLMRSKRRSQIALVVAVAMVAALFVMPQGWRDRVESIRDYQADTSAMQRFNSWTFAWRFAKEHPVLGGGFEVFNSDELQAQYSPNPQWVFDAHSIYFQVLAEHGFVGLALFLILLAASWRRLSRLARADRGDGPVSTEAHATGELARALQASMVAYMAGGLFLGLAYFDLPYNIIGLVVVLDALTRRGAADAAAIEKQSTGPTAVNAAVPGHG